MAHPTTTALIEAEQEFKASAPGIRIIDAVNLEIMANRIVAVAQSIAAAAPLINGNNTRPTVSDLAIRMVESIDDQLSPEAWAVVNTWVRASVNSHQNKEAA